MGLQEIGQTSFKVQLAYITTDSGPQRWWMYKIGRAESLLCGQESAEHNADGWG